MRRICATCGVEFGDGEPSACPICEDERQWVPIDGQHWTTMEELRERHRNELRPEGELVGIGSEPRFAIGQRALLVPHGGANLLWDCVTLLDDATAEQVERRGGLSAIAISHPHYYSSMVGWARRFQCPVYLHEDDRRWVMREDPLLRFWSGETHALGDGATLVRCGGHFAGGSVLVRERMLLSGDIVQLIPDRGWVSFMYSYPNLIPLGPREIERIVAALAPYEFDAIYGAWWGTLIERDGAAIVRRSAKRYLAALQGLHTR